VLRRFHAPPTQFETLAACACTFVYLDLWLSSVCNRDSRHDIQAKVLRRYIQAPSCELRGKGFEGSRDTKRVRVWCSQKDSLIALHIYLMATKTLRGNAWLDAMLESNLLINGARVPRRMRAHG